MAKRILIVDDEKDLIDMLEVRLKASGYEVTAAYDGEEALDKVHHLTPDLIILDLMLPKIDGYKVCRMIKFDERYRKVPVIIFSARAQEEDQEMGREVGADAYLIKPFKPEILLKKIQELLGEDIKEA